MPKKKYLRGVGEKAQRQYEHIKEEAKNKAGTAGVRRRSLHARC